MAKKDQQAQSSDVQANVVEATAVEAQSSTPVVQAEPAPMPVEKQQDAHDSVNLKAALQPGRPFVAGPGLLGEIETFIHNAEQSGEHVLAGSLHMIRVKAGELLAHIHSLEQDAADYVKPLYAKLIAFFKK